MAHVSQKKEKWPLTGEWQEGHTLAFTLPTNLSVDGKQEEAMFPSNTEGGEEGGSVCGLNFYI